MIYDICVIVAAIMASPKHMMLLPGVIVSVFIELTAWIDSSHIINDVTRTRL